MEQTVNLVQGAIRPAMKREKKRAAERLLHSEQGAQYASQAYFELAQTCGITPFMPKRGGPYDNPMS